MKKYRIARFLGHTSHMFDRGVNCKSDVLGFDNSIPMEGLMHHTSGMPKRLKSESEQAAICMLCSKLFCPTHGLGLQIG